MRNAHPFITEQICGMKAGGKAANRLRGALLLGTLHAFCLAPLAAEEKAEEKAEAKVEAATETGKAQPADIAEKIRAIFPGITINSEERFVDVQSVVCLAEGYLEVIACAKDSREHESIVMVEAKPSHIHAALLLIGARPGNPAMRKPVDEEGTRWIDIPPRGQAVKVSLLLPDEKGVMKERPISDFVSSANDELEGTTQAAGAADKFQDSFVFAGSISYQEGETKTYLGDVNGNVISISTFGDEVLCLSGRHTQDDHALSWRITPDTMPEIGTKVILRMRPQAAEQSKE